MPEPLGKVDESPEDADESTEAERCPADGNRPAGQHDEDQRQHTQVDERHGKLGGRGRERGSRWPMRPPPPPSPTTRTRWPPQAGPHHGDSRRRRRTRTASGCATPAREQRLGGPGLLLLPQPDDRLHGARGGEHADDREDRRDEELDERSRIPRRRSVAAPHGCRARFGSSASELLIALPSASGEEAAERAADRPADDGRPLQTPGETEHAGERRPRQSARPGRSAMRPAPESRTDCRAKTPATRTAARPSWSRSGHHRSAVYGAACCPQPIGLSQLGHAGQVRAVAERRACRVADAAHQVRRHDDRRGGSVRPARRAHHLREQQPDAEEGEARAAPSRRRREATRATGRPDGDEPEAGDRREQDVRHDRMADGRHRRAAAAPAGVAATSSARPDSSSARECRTARKVFISPASRARKVKISKKVRAASVDPCGRPRRTRMVGSAMASRISCTRAAALP